MWQAKDRIEIGGMNRGMGRAIDPAARPVSIPPIPDHLPDLPRASAFSGEALLPDPSFERLLGALAWRRLPESVRERFRWKPAPGSELRYVGTMAEVRCSTFGWWLERVFRAIGTPLAPHSGRDVPVSVTLRLDRDGHGIVWERRYAFAGKAPVLCRSVKRATDAGLIECVGRGVGMWLSLTVRNGALHFDSTGYFWRLGRLTLHLPRWLTPGALHVAHIDEGGGRFRFRIAVTHPRFGEIFYQDGVFERERSVP
jgi:Domain of unknown function (DUF4166)